GAERATRLRPPRAGVPDPLRRPSRACPYRWRLLLGVLRPQVAGRHAAGASRPLLLLHAVVARAGHPAGAVADGPVAQRAGLAVLRPRHRPARPPPPPGVA